MQCGVSPATATETREKQEKDTETLGVTYTIRIRNDRMQTVNAVEDVQEEEEEGKKGEREGGRKADKRPRIRREQQGTIMADRAASSAMLRNMKYANTRYADRESYGSGDSTGRWQRAMSMTATMTHVYASICGKEGISRSANQPRCQPIGCFTSHLCGNLYRNASALLAGRSSTDSRSA
ncbi:hypothetical protein ALC53_12232 [Atta colombica]|uniref:Uncharacterized protein n=1 Tax=Atta colombica TaxID=520822 RepID=A0A195AYI0_9HYME|nr:hypothetical protein ALC53_12232 [Atta colombica]